MQKVEGILCPTDFSEGSLQALATAKDVAKRFGAELCLVYVLPIMPVLPTDPKFAFETAEYERLLHEDAQQRLNNIVRELEREGMGSRAFLGHGDAASVIVRISEQQQIDLIVIATFGKTGWRRFAFGSVTEKVVRLAPCPVLTIRGVEPTSQPLELSKTIGSNHTHGFVRVK